MQSGSSWPPAGAAVYADFVHGNYYAGGAVRTATALWTQNTALGTFNASTDITAGGLSAQYTSPVMARAYSAGLLNNFTVVMESILPSIGRCYVSQISVPGYATQSSITSENGNDYLFCGGETPDTVNGSSASTGLRKTAATVSSSGMKLCTNGGAIYTEAITHTQSPTDIYAFINDAGVFIRKFTFYSGIKSDAELQALTV